MSSWKKFTKQVEHEKWAFFAIKDIFNHNDGSGQLWKLIKNWDVMAKCSVEMKHFPKYGYQEKRFALKHGKTTYCKMLKSMLRHFLQHVASCLMMLNHVSTCWKITVHVATCFDMLQQDCRNMLRHVLRHVLQHVETRVGRVESCCTCWKGCFVFRHDETCFDMLKHGKFHNMLINMLQHAHVATC